MGTDSWFCDSQAHWQKGTVENTSNRLRRHLHRTTDPTILTPKRLRRICRKLNSTPSKCLGYRTPAEVFESRLLEIRNRVEWDQVSVFALRRGLTCNQVEVSHFPCI